MSRGTDDGRARSQAARQARAVAAGYSSYAEQYRAEHPERAVRQGARAEGRSPRQTASNPRRKAKNPSAGTPADIARVNREQRRAIARLHARGDYWCTVCDDSGFTYPADAAVPCDHPPMTAADADLILHPD